MIYRERPIDEIWADLQLNVPAHTTNLSEHPDTSLIFYEECGEVYFQEAKLLAGNRNVTDAKGQRLDDIAFWRWKHRLRTLETDIRIRLAHVRAEMARRGMASNLVNGRP